MLARLAIVGRPNVGKSTLFNRIVGRRRAIVHSRPGITRDRVEEEVEWNGRRFILVDTGGMGVGREDDPFREKVTVQAELAVETADCIILMTDGRDGLLPLDREIAGLLRRSARPFVLAVNKIDEPGMEAEAAEAAELGVGEIYPVSAEHGRGVGDLLDACVSHLPHPPEAPEESNEPPAIRTALVGRPNVGKSSIMNLLLGEERSIVHDTPGTTRDSLAVRIETSEGGVILMDTAGIRRRSRRSGILEAAMVSRSTGAVMNSDLGLVVTDASEGFTDQDSKVILDLLSRGRGAVVLLNKWDLVEKDEVERIEYNLERRLGINSHCPVLRTSAATGRGIDKILPLAAEVGRRMGTVIPTGLLNRTLSEIDRGLPAGKRIMYGTQAGTNPPRIMLFVRGRFGEGTKRRIERRIRDLADLRGVPIGFVLKRSSRGER